MTESGLARIFEEDFVLEAVGPSRHCPHRQSLVPLHRMREMGDAFATSDIPRDLRTRWRLWSMHHALEIGARRFNQIAERTLDVPAAFEAWRQIAPSIELVGVRKPA